MAVAFTRQLGYESGVQLNPLQDNSELSTTDNSDQIFGIIMRATRGRVDKPFVVEQSDVYTKLGSGEQIRVNALNEAWVHVVEALSNGAYQAVIQRLVADDYAISYLVVTKSEEESTDDDGNTTTTVTYTASVEESLPDDYFIAVRHLGCFNDGIILSFHADEEYDDSGDETGNDVITLRISDSDGNKVFEYTGSLDADAVDDYNNSYYLPDIVAKYTDELEVYVGVTGDDAVVSPDGDGYGYDDDGTQAWYESDVMVCFDEGSSSYTTQNYIEARQALEYCNYDFAYISSGGTQSSALLAQLALLAFNTNKQLRFDIPGDLEAEDAITWVDQLNMGSQKCAHLMQAFWAPVKSDDPTGVNPKGYFGMATLNIAYACGRNAVKNAKGFAAKNYPIAGREWPINRTGMTQTASVKGTSILSKLAKAKINPCIYETYTGGGRYVFYDSLTCALVNQSLRKLIAVADMSTSIDDMVTKAAKDYLQLPITVAIKRLSDYLTDLFAAAEASGWLVPSSDASMEGKSHKFEVVASETSPHDTLVVNYWLRYDGTTRQIFVTQTLTK